MSGIENKVVAGKVNADATALGSYALADDVQILDTTAEGVAGTVRPSRLAGTDLNLLNVRYYTLNEKGEIDRLILNDVTGDCGPTACWMISRMWQSTTRNCRRWPRSFHRQERQHGYAG